MREIKFAAWDGFEMVEGLSLAEASNLVKVRDVQLLLWTGLKDKNGKDIYEAYICRIEFETNLGVVPELGEVVWLDNEARYTIKSSLPDILETNSLSQPPIIVGNIYENPELLRKKTK